MSSKISVNETYGKLNIVEEFYTDKGYKRYVCLCKSCGKQVIFSGQEILRHKEFGCRSCTAKARETKKNIEYNTHIGEIYGNLEITEFIGFKKQKNGKSVAYMKCKCSLCNSETEIPYSRLKSGGAKQCKSCSQRNLSKGHEIIENSAIDGTSIICIDGRRKINVNNVSGVSGVSFHKKSGKYRAYINFQHKQYNLGSYYDISSAAQVRKEAEKQLYGNFCEWYMNTYPKKWEKIQSTRK